MTEAEWLTCARPLRMLAYLHPDPNGRKVLLLTCACAGRVWERLTPEVQEWLRAAEQYVEGQRTLEELRTGVLQR